MIQPFRDFFLLVYNEEQTPPPPSPALLEALKEEGIDLYTILLAGNARTLENYQRIDFIEEKVRAWLGESLTLENLQTLQLATLMILSESGSSRIFQEILERLSELKRQGVLFHEEEQRIRAILHQLISLLAPATPPAPLPVESSGEIFHESFLKSHTQRIETLQARLKEALGGNESLQALEPTIENLKAQKFSIGVTGVMSAGKSTMLNAILQRDLLGTSVIPETANLTILRYGAEEKARVHFWNSHEWHLIAQSAELDEGVDYFMKESLTLFGAVLDEYITPEGRVYEIPLSDLSTYTSAKHPSKLCHLVKSVEIFTPLEFLGEGVEIVDTPGLDDPLTQREEITRGYLSRCDVMLHLMNAAQSATQKDIDFIIDALIYQNVSRLLVILTRVDTLSSEELKTAISYTQKSLKERLWAYNQQASFEELLGRLEFAPLAAKMALAHRLGNPQEALERGYELEDTGILKVESYLRERLFGKEAQKAKTLLYGACKEILSVLETLLQESGLQKELLYQSLENLETRLETLRLEEESTASKLHSINTTLATLRQSLLEHGKRLDSMLELKLIETRNIIKERVIDDINYSLTKNRPISANHLENMVELGLRDGLSDIARAYRHQFAKRLHFLSQEIEGEFKALESLLEPSFLEENLHTLHEVVTEEFKEGRYLEGGAILKKSLATIVPRHTKAHDNALEREVEHAFELAFSLLLEAALKRTSALQEELLEHFDLIIKRLNLHITSALERQRSLLEREIALKQNQEANQEEQEKRLLLQEEAILSAREEVQGILKEAL